MLVWASVVSEPPQGFHSFKLPDGERCSVYSYRLHGCVATEDFPMWVGDFEYVSEDRRGEGKDGLEDAEIHR